jgi:hypothetical protein
MAKRKSNSSSYKILFDRSSAVAAGIGTALVASSSQARVPTQSVNTVEIELGAESRGTAATGSPLPVDLVLGQSTPSIPTVTVREHENEWTESDQKRFKELAVAEAVGELSDDEMFELESLSQLRRAVHEPRSGDEVLWDLNNAG